MESLLDPKDYYTPEGKFEITHYYRDLHKKHLTLIDVDSLKTTANYSDTVTLYHGTTTAYLNEILQNGLLPRKETSKDNWKGELSSAENVVYLTTKWHYFYAYQSTDAYLREKAKSEGKDFQPWWVTWESLPCYIECEVPKALLVADEDFFHSQYISQRIKSVMKNQKESLSVTWEESLAHYGTAGVLGGVMPEFIRSFSVLGESKLYHDLILSKSQYSKDLAKWGNGKGKGTMKLLDIMKREDESLMNGAWLTKDLPKGKTIAQIGVNEKSGTIALAFE